MEKIVQQYPTMPIQRTISEKEAFERLIPRVFPSPLSIRSVHEDDQEHESEDQQQSATIL